MTYIFKYYYLEVAISLGSCGSTDRGDCTNVRCGQAREVEKDTGLADAVNLIGTAPGTAVEGIVRKELVGVGMLGLGILGTLGIVEVGEEDGRHDGVGGLGGKDLVRDEVGHAFVGPGEGAVLDDGGSRGGGGDVGRDGATLGPGDDGAPMLQTLSEDVVGTLGDTDAVDEVERTALSLEGGANILAQHLASAEKAHEDAVGLLGEGLVVLGGSIVSLLGDEVGIGGSAQVGKAGTLALLGEVTADGVHGQRNLNVSSAVEVGIGTDGELATGVELEEPIADHGSLSEEIATGRGVELVVALAAGRLLLLHGEGEGTGRLASDANETLPDTRTVQIDGHDVGTKSHEDEEGSHGRTGTQKDEVTVAKVEVAGAVGALDDGIAGAGLDGAVFHPLANLGLESIAREGLAFVGDLQYLVGLGGLSLDVAGVELVGGGLGHGLAKADGLSVGVYELEGVVGLVHTGVGHVEGGLGRFALLLDETEKVLEVAESPVALVAALLGLVGVGNLDGGGNDLLGGGSGGTDLLGSLGTRDGEDDASRRRGRLGKALLEGRPTVAGHVHDHGQSTGGVDDGEGHDEVVHGLGVLLSVRVEKDGILGSRQKDRELTGNAGGIQNGKEGVAQPKQREGCLLGGVAADDGKDVEQIPRNLDEGPRQNHHTGTELHLRLRGVRDGKQCRNATTDLEGRNEDGTSHEAESGVDNLQEGCRLDVKQDGGQIIGAINGRQGLADGGGVGQEGIEDDGQGHVQNAGPAGAAGQVVGDQVQILGACHGFKLLVAVSLLKETTTVSRDAFLHVRNAMASKQAPTVSIPERQQK